MENELRLTDPGALRAAWVSSNASKPRWIFLPTFKLGAAEFGAARRGV